MAAPYASEDRFREAFNTVEAYIERRYDLPVVISDVTDPFTGDLDGASIAVDYDQSWEDALFIIAHLFGHTVQWNTEPRAREIGTVPVTSPTEELLAEVRDYEKKACRYSLQLFHDAGVRDILGGNERLASVALLVHGAAAAVHVEDLRVARREQDGARTDDKRDVGPERERASEKGLSFAVASREDHRLAGGAVIDGVLDAIGIELALVTLGDRRVTDRVQGGSERRARRGPPNGDHPH